MGLYDIGYLRDYLRVRDLRDLRDLETYRFIDRPRLDDFFVFLREERPPLCSPTFTYFVNNKVLVISDIALPLTGRYSFHFL